MDLMLNGLQIKPKQPVINQKYDKWKLVNLGQTNEILLIELLTTKYSFRNLWLNVYIYIYKEFGV